MLATFDQDLTLSVSGFIVPDCHSFEWNPNDETIKFVVHGRSYGPMSVEWL